MACKLIEVSSRFNQLIIKFDLFQLLKVTIQVFRNAEGKEEFGDDPYLQIQRKEICEFMKTTYKDQFFPILEGCSNFPKPDECPVNPVSWFLNQIE